MHKNEIGGLCLLDFLVFKKIITKKMASRMHSLGLSTLKDFISVELRELQNVHGVGPKIYDIVYRVKSEFGLRLFHDDVMSLLKKMKNDSEEYNQILRNFYMEQMREHDDMAQATNRHVDALQELIESQRVYQDVLGTHPCIIGVKRKPGEKTEYLDGSWPVEKAMVEAKKHLADGNDRVGVFRLIKIFSQFTVE